MPKGDGQSYLPRRFLNKSLVSCADGSNDARYAKSIQEIGIPGPGIRMTIVWMITKLDMVFWPPVIDFTDRLAEIVRIPRNPLL